MGGDVVSGGIVVVLAAALWLAYLLPTWLRRREFQATERNAVRLQQTLRILAETSEVPEEVRVEATAREVAVQQRILRKAEARTHAELQARAAREATRRHAEALADAEAEAAADAVAAQAERAARLAHADAARAARVETARADSARAMTVAAPAAARPSRAMDASHARARRVRRSRAATSLLLVVGLIAAVWGLALALAATGSWLVPAGSAIVMAAAVVNLGRLARAGRSQRVTVAMPAAPAASELFDHAAHDEPAPAVAGTWTPRPLPKPLYQSPGSVAASAMASVDAVTRLRRAAATAELDRRAAELAEVLAPEVTRLTPRPGSKPAASGTPVAVLAQPEGPNRYARMGVVDDVEAGALDLDAALRRRRAAG
ncbi:MAG: hypothetical protein ABI310_10130 [Microbacteriaceae bacterium]